MSLIRCGCYAALVLLAAGCATSAPERFYTLESIGPASPAVKSVSRVTLARVTVPVLVDRPEMVFQGDAGQVEISEQNRWAEPLRDGVGRVLAEDLTTRLGGALVTTYPDAAREASDVRASVDIRQWQVWPGRKIGLSVLWTLRFGGASGSGASASATGAPMVKEGRVDLEIPITTPGASAALAAQNQALAQLADALALAIRALPPS
jgi:uncharacterized lipoprotein YmbA